MASDNADTLHFNDTPPDTTGLAGSRKPFVVPELQREASLVGKTAGRRFFETHGMS
jgi:hypothetical protein